MKILFTAFKGIHNTSFQLVNQIAEQTGADYVLLTNSFQGLKKDIASISGNYDIVHMFGADAHLTDEIRIETCAKNNNNEILNTDYDIFLLEEKLRAGKVLYTVSHQPACYLCNTAYYHMLRKDPNTVFIHIPSLRRMTAEKIKQLIEVFSS